MARFHIETHGCKTNIADSLALRARLLAAGHAEVAAAADADVVIVNTCSVTHRADGDARRSVRAFRRRNAEARVIVTGCAAERAPDEVGAWEGVSEVVGNRRKADLLPMLTGAPSADAADGTLWDAPASYPQFQDAGYTRAFVKVQDGCDANCSFCVIPVTRGASRSLPLPRVVEAVRALGESGASEVVLTGIHLGHWGRDRGTRLETLLARLAALERPRRIRVTSIEPNEMTDSLADALTASPRFAPHVHLPLQSGSASVLSRMRRPYNPSQYARAVERVARRRPGIGIGADVITGFPGETDADFAATESLVRSLPLTYLHVFSYSERAGTEAATLDGKVDPRVIKSRTERLRRLDRELRSRFAASLVGRGETVLTLERRKGGATAGLTGTFVKARLAGAYPINELIEVHVARAESGEIVAESRAIDARERACS